MAILDYLKPKQSVREDTGKGLFLKAMDTAVEEQKKAAVASVPKQSVGVKTISSPATKQSIVQTEYPVYDSTKYQSYDQAAKTLSAPMTNIYNSPATKKIEEKTNFASLAETFMNNNHAYLNAVKDPTPLSMQIDKRADKVGSFFDTTASTLLKSFTGQNYEPLLNFLKKSGDVSSISVPTDNKKIQTASDISVSVSQLMQVSGYLKSLINPNLLKIAPKVMALTTPISRAAIDQAKIKYNTSLVDRGKYIYNNLPSYAAYYLAGNIYNKIKPLEYLGAAATVFTGAYINNSLNGMEKEENLPAAIKETAIFSLFKLATDKPSANQVGDKILKSQLGLPQDAPKSAVRDSVLKEFKKVYPESSLFNVYDGKTGAFVKTSFATGNVNPNVQTRIDGIKNLYNSVYASKAVAAQYQKSIEKTIWQEIKDLYKIQTAGKGIVAYKPGFASLSGETPEAQKKYEAAMSKKAALKESETQKILAENPGGFSEQQLKQLPPEAAAAVLSSMKQNAPQLGTEVPKEEAPKYTPVEEEAKRISKLVYDNNFDKLVSSTQVKKMSKEDFINMMVDADLATNVLYINNTPQNQEIIRRNFVEADSDKWAEVYNNIQSFSQKRETNEPATIPAKPAITPIETPQQVETPVKAETTPTEAKTTPQKDAPQENILPKEYSVKFTKLPKSFGYKDGGSMILFKGDKKIATAKIDFVKGKMVVNEIGTIGGIKGTGEGTLLLKYIEQQAKEKGAQEILAEVVLPESVGYWEKQGYSAIGEEYGSPIMSKSLKTKSQLIDIWNKAQGLTKQETFDKIKADKYQVGITTATDKSSDIQQMIKDANKLEASGKFKQADKIFNKILDRGESRLKGLFKDMPGVKIKVERTMASFFGSTEPTFKTEVTVINKKDFKKVAERLARLGRVWKQENVHISKILNNVPDDIKLGVVQKDGSVYEPEMTYIFDKKLTRQQYREVSEKILEISLPGSTLLGDGKGINLYNVSKFKPYEEFKQQAKKLGEWLHSKGMSGRYEAGTRQLWNYGDPKNGATRTYEQIAGPVPGQTAKGGGREITASEAEYNRVMDKIFNSLEEKINPAKTKMEMTGNQFQRTIAKFKRIGFIQGEKITREELTNLFKTRLARIEEARDLIKSYIEENLPVDLRGKYLNAVANNPTIKKYQSIAERVDREVQNFIKKDLITDLKSISKTKANLPADYKRKLEELVSWIDFSKPTQKTLEGLKKLQKYITDNGVPSGISVKELNSIERLTKKNIGDLTVNELKNLKSAMETVVAQGILKFRLKFKYNQRLREFELKKVISSTNNISKKLEGLGDKNLVKLLFPETLKILHSYRVADMIDGYANYRGENAKIVKKFNRAEDTANANMIKIQTKILEEMKAIGVKKLTNEQQWKMMINIRIQEGAYDAANTLMNVHNITEVPKLTEQEQGVIDIIRKNVGEAYVNEIAAVYEEIYPGKSFDRIENYTVKLGYKNEGTVDPEFILKQTFNRGMSVSKGFTYKRVEGVTRIPREDLMALVSETISEQQWFLNIQPLLENYKYILLDERYKAAAGEDAYNWWVNQLKIMANHGNMTGAWNSQFFNILNKNLNTAILGFKLTSSLVQPFALVDAMSYAQAKWGAKTSLEILKVAANVLVNPKISKKIVDESNALKTRLGGEIGVQDLTADKLVSENIKQKLVSLGLKGLKIGDIVASSVAEKAFYNILIKAGLTHEQAIEEADFLMDLVAGSSNATSRPQALAYGTASKILFAFQSFALNRWGILSHDIIMSGLIKSADSKGPDGRKGDDWDVGKLGDKNRSQLGIKLSRKFNSLLGLLLFIIGGAVEQLVRGEIDDLIKGRDRKSKFLSIENVISRLLSNIPLLGNMISTQFEGGDYNVPVVRTINNALIGAKNISSGETSKTKLKGAMKIAETSLTLGTGAPGTAQVFDILENIFGTNKKESSSQKNNLLGESLLDFDFGDSFSPELDF